jgi:hypothetical protein
VTGARKARVVLQEKGLDFTMKVEKAWERRPEFLALNPVDCTEVCRLVAWFDHKMNHEVTDAVALCRAAAGQLGLRGRPLLADRAQGDADPAAGAAQRGATKGEGRRRLELPVCSQGRNAADQTLRRAAASGAVARADKR